MKKISISILVLLVAFSVGCGKSKKKEEAKLDVVTSPKTTKFTYSCELLKSKEPLTAILQEDGDLFLTGMVNKDQGNNDETVLNEFGFPIDVQSVLFDSKPAELAEIYGTWTLVGVTLVGKKELLIEEAMWKAIVSGEMSFKKVQLTFTKESVKLTGVMQGKGDPEARSCAVEAKAKVEEASTPAGSKGKTYKIQVLEDKRTDLSFEVPVAAEKKK
jgi:hypothetical protein